MNRLAHETSPYLLQHQDNPVDWFPWGEEAFEKARAEDRPILLSVGYSTCHWCHVMAHESFEDARVAALMNADFVCVKVDREERPDVDGVYMAAVQAATGQGGWPMTLFLTPDGAPFYAGTYFPPTDRYGMPGFARVLASVAGAWKERRADLLQNASALSDFLKEQTARAREERDLPEDFTERGLANLRKFFDARNGGFGTAPKFPAPTTLNFLLTQPSARDMAFTTLEKMASGGLYDQLGGGFHRYSVDERWLVPHFEKMLYDNAQLVRVYLHAWQLSNRPEFERIVRETLAYLEREMRLQEGGFFSAQDADSEGIEGKFFVWTPDEVREVLGADTNLALRYWGVTDAGNFQDPHYPEFGRRSVLSVAARPETLAAEPGLSEEDLTARLQDPRRQLFAAREERVHPGTDTKILTSWNGLALAAFAEAGRILGDSGYIETARHNAEFVRDHLISPNGGLFHSYKDGVAKVTGLLEDHALYGLGLVELYKATGELSWLSWARDLWNVVKADFWDEEAGAFWGTSQQAERLITRQQNAFDSAVLSDNAGAALLGLWIGRYFGEEDGERIAHRVVSSFSGEMLGAPSGFGGLWQVWAFLESQPVEIAVLGSEAARQPFERELARFFLPFAAVAPADKGEGLPVLEGRAGEGVAYVCRNFACDLPARDVETFAAQLGRLGSRK